MTERLRDLLDGAVAGLEPAVPDPVTTVVRRSRRGTRRRAAAWVAAAVVLGGGGTVAAQQLRTQQPAPPAGVASPAIPYVDGDTVVAGGLRLPVPDGWRVVTANTTVPCGKLTDAVLIVTAEGRGCEAETAPIEIDSSLDNQPQGIMATAPGSDAETATAPVPITLAGGEPGWLMEGFDTEGNAPGKDPRYGYYNVLHLPWSELTLTLRMDGPRQQATVATLSSAPSGAGALALPPTVRVAELTRSDPAQANAPTRHSRTRDAAVIGDVLRLMRGQRGVIGDAEACANPGQQTLRLVLSPQEVPDPATGSSPEERARINADPPPLTLPGTVVLITLGGGCQEAVSQDGGRVRLGDETVAELQELFG